MQRNKLKQKHSDSTYHENCPTKLDTKWGSCKVLTTKYIKYNPIITQKSILCLLLPTRRGQTRKYNIAMQAVNQNTCNHP